MDAHLEEILKDNEWTPNNSQINSSKNWKKVNSYYVYLSPPKLTYKITDDLIETMNKYNAIYKLNKGNFVPNTTQSNVSKIFKIYDSKSDLVLYGYTSMSILRWIKSNLQRYLRKVSSPFDSFDDIKKIKVELITIVKDADRESLDSIKKKLKSKHLNRDIEEYIKEYEKIIKNYKLSAKVAYIYIFTNSTTNKMYIGATNENINEKNKTKIINYIIKKYKHIKRNKGAVFDIKVLGKVKYSTKIGLYLIVDKHINTFDSIDNGYNLNFRYINRLNRRKFKEKLKKDIQNEIDGRFDE